MTVKFKSLSALIAFSVAFSSTAFAENCRAIPAGPERAACARREHPAMFEAKLEHCKQLAMERGDTTGHNRGASAATKEFVQGCMQGKQH
jgi:hypothetical protein